MSQSPTATTSGFDTPARERLLRFLAARGQAREDDLLALTPDASTREYFRFPWKKRTAVAAVYPEPFDPNFHPYLDVTRLFLEHYFGSLRGEHLSHGEAAELKAEMNDVAAELSARPRVLCHRDFHPSNLMVDKKNRLRIVDHQDARMGPASYDLVSLLLDRQAAPPSLAEVRAHRLFFLEERRRFGLGSLDPDEFAHEF